MATNSLKGRPTYTKPHPITGFEFGRFGDTTGSGRPISAGGSDGGGYSYSAPVIDQEENLKNLIENLYGSIFRQADIEYTPQTADELGKQISGWLLPGYEQAIESRRELTGEYGAELDADAIARGMGASTYVTDVKSRQQRDEASDVATLQSEYGATLAQNVMEQLTAQMQTKTQVDMFNAEMRQSAYQSAYQAALVLLQRGVVSTFVPEQDEEEEDA